MVRSETLRLCNQIDIDLTWSATAIVNMRMFCETSM